MVNVPVCSVVEAFTIDGLLTTLMPIVSPDVKNLVGIPPDRVFSWIMEFGVFEMIVMFELLNVLEKSVTLNATRD
jgi:hypothetical protein